MSSDTTWTIAGIEATALLGRESPTPTRGETLSLEFRFRGDEAVETAYPALLEYLDYPPEEAIRVGTSDRGRPWYRERLPDDAPVESLIVDVRPGLDIIDVDGFWAAVVGGEDESQPPANQRVVALELFILAPLDEYDDRHAVADDLADTL